MLRNHLSRGTDGKQQRRDFYPGLIDFQLSFWQFCSVIHLFPPKRERWFFLFLNYRSNTGSLFFFFFFKGG